MVANAKGVVVGAKDAVTTTVTGAKDTVAHTVTGVVDKTKGAVHDSVEMTKSVVNGSINTVLGSRVVQIMSSGVDSALSRSETLVDQYLPLTEEELGKTSSMLDKATRGRIGVDRQAESLLSLLYQEGVFHV